jgi:hypothetical protein
MEECYQFYENLIDTELLPPPIYNIINYNEIERDRHDLEQAFPNNQHPTQPSTEHVLDIIFIMPQAMAQNFMNQRTPNALNELLTQLLSGFRLADPQDVPLPMTDDALSHLPVKKYSELTNTSMNDICSICQENYDPSVDVTILPCNHYFHRDCIEQWLRNYHHKCPVCRCSCGEHTALINE